MQFLKIFTNYKLFEIFVLGVISGMPLAIIFSTIGAWLKESGIALEVITTFAIARLSYSLKFLWAPIVDYFKVPILGRLGHRKSWLILCSIANLVILFLMSSISSPVESLSFLYFLAIALGMFAATFDISVDAFRIETFDANTQGVAAANVVLGYRIGMLITGGVALEIAHISNSWNKAFLFMSLVLSVLLIFLFTVREQQIIRDKISKLTFNTLKQLIITPFKDFLTKDAAVIILITIMLFKLGDAMLGVVSMPFYLELGYTKQQIAVVVKGLGLIATILGAYCGGFVNYAIGPFKGLILAGIIQALTNLAFIWLNHAEIGNIALFTAISMENFGAGMGSAALVAYLSILCNKKYSATQYALLSATASFFNNSITIYGGTLVKLLGWDNFFILTIILSLPSILLLFYLNKKVKIS
jgi:MFS transporter, PAT family, beta-lactamase induction signal transducer AmpG